MRDLRTLDKNRVTVSYYGWAGNGSCGAFVMPSPVDDQPLRVIAATEEKWDHVSVSRQDRCPDWIEMEFIKRRFFEDDECVMQLHVPVADHINDHPYCLHLWRPQKRSIPRPPPWMVSPRLKR